MVDPSLVMAAADKALSRILVQRAQPVEDFRALKYRYAAESRAYYSLAAMTRRRNLESNVRAEALAKLFRMRSTLERTIISDLEVCGLRRDLVDTWATRSFFGVSAKQGVSVRYALASCVPTRTCGGRCYAHDGRDREIHRIFRGALNLFVGERYDRLDTGQRAELLERLAPAIAYGVSAAREDQTVSRNEFGYDRAPRIRFSHVGEMAATPEFTNDLAREIRRFDPAIACVIYTRHPNAPLLDPEALTINFTLESEEDPRRAWVPTGSRVVASAWDGRLSASAAVNFLEHHVEKVVKPAGTGAICPVTADHGSITSCDGARCQLCFVQPASKT